MNQPLYERLIALHAETVTPLISEDREETTAKNLITILKETRATSSHLANADKQRLLENIMTLALSAEDQETVEEYITKLEKIGNIGGNRSTKEHFYKFPLSVENQKDILSYIHSKVYEGNAKEIKKIQESIYELYGYECFIKINRGYSTLNFDGNIRIKEKLKFIYHLHTGLQRIIQQREVGQQMYAYRVPDILAVNDEYIVFEKVDILGEVRAKSIGGGRNPLIVHEFKYKEGMTSSTSEKEAIYVGITQLEGDLHRAYEEVRSLYIQKVDLDIRNQKNLFFEGFKGGKPNFLIHDVLNML